MRKLIISIITVAIAIAVCTVILFSGARPKDLPAAAYDIYVYPDGSAQIKLESINQVVQTHEDVTVDGMELKAGTVILPGNGDPIYYEYPRHDKVIN